MEKEYKLTLKKIIKHFYIITKHRFIVFILSIKAGIPIQGLLHDLSKYSPVEFFETARFYSDGKKSPILLCREINGYSKAWLHHKGRNKHHYEYWYDYAIDNKPVMPFKYYVEFIIDTISASMTYHNKYNIDEQISYWDRIKKTAILDKKMEQLITYTYKMIKQDGLSKILNKKKLREFYNKYIN